MKRFLLVPFVILLMGVLIFGGCPKPAPTTAPVTPPEKPIELKFAYWIPSVSAPARVVIEPWGKEIEERTNGKVNITFFGDASMGAPPEHYQLCLSGMADITWIAPGMTFGVFPLSMAFEQPMLFSSAEQGSRVSYKLVEKYLLDTEYKDVKVLWVSEMAPSQLFTVAKQVRTLEDLKGMKLAGTSPPEVSAMGELGASAVQMGTEPEMYTALERGLVDGRFNSWEGAATFKDFEVTKYRTGNVHFQAHFNAIIMNLDTWNSLPPDVQKIFEETTGLQLSQSSGALLDAENETGLQRIIEYDKMAGNPDIYYLPDTERAKWVEALMPARENWANQLEAEGLSAKAFLEELLSLLK